MFCVCMWSVFYSLVRLDIFYFGEGACREREKVKVPEKELLVEQGPLIKR